MVKKKTIQLKHEELPEFREKLLKKQKGKCALCGESVTRPCVDHEHVKRIKGSGLVRGVICSNCNVFLGKVENNCVRCGVKIVSLPERLNQMADYLKRPHTEFMHPNEAPKPKKLTKTSYNKLKKAYTGKQKFPPYPERFKKLTKPLERLFKEYSMKPEYYK